MHRTSPISLTMSVVALALAATAHGQVPEAERVPITDPALLQSLGYSPGAENVYMRAHPGGDIVPTAAERSELQPAEFGSALFHTAASGFAFHPISNTMEFAKGPAFLVFNGALVSLTSGGIFEAQLDLPQGAHWRFLDIVGFHDSSHDLVVSLAQRCLPLFGSGNPTETILATTTVTDQDGDFFECLTVDATVDNSLCTYHVRAVFGDGDPPDPGVLIQLTKARAEWRRQVSPAPATPTFDDVPTSHLFYQHIEALAASGITAGCDADSYCPNDPLTRGQMAVFLAKALGLHWGI